MSSSSKGSGREYAVIDSFIERGFWYIKAQRSGQCIKEERKPYRVPGDAWVIHPNMGAAFQIEVGGAGKRLRVEFDELRARLLPGFSPLVVMFTKGTGKQVKRRYYTSPTDRFDSLDELLESKRRAA